jgi:hypothetical protein
VATETIALRIAGNQHAFREANERIEETAGGLLHDIELLPFICECPDRDCVEIARLKRHEYECVRAKGNRFFVVPGHEVVEVEGETVARVGQRFDRFSIMEKVGEAGERAKELDPRAAG